MSPHRCVGQGDEHTPQYTQGSMCVQRFPGRMKNLMGWGICIDNEPCISLTLKRKTVLKGKFSKASRFLSGPGVWHGAFPTDWRWFKLFPAQRNPGGLNMSFSTFTAFSRYVYNYLLRSCCIHWLRLLSLFEPQNTLKWAQGWKNPHSLSSMNSKLPLTRDV